MTETGSAWDRPAMAEVAIAYAECAAEAAREGDYLEAVRLAAAAGYAAQAVIDGAE